jgi:hypothetical protein
MVQETCELTLVDDLAGKLEKQFQPDRTMQNAVEIGLPTSACRHGSSLNEIVDASRVSQEYAATD